MSHWVIPIGLGHREVPGGSHLAAAAMTGPLGLPATAVFRGASAVALTHTPATILSRGATAVFTGAAARALSGTALIIVAGGAATSAALTRARGPPQRSASPGSAGRGHHAWWGSCQLQRPQDKRRADGCIHGPELTCKPFRRKERDNVERQYFTSDSRSSVASPNRSRHRRSEEPDP